MYFFSKKNWNTDLIFRSKSGDFDAFSLDLERWSTCRNARNSIGPAPENEESLRKSTPANGQTGKHQAPHGPYSSHRKGRLAISRICEKTNERNFIVLKKFDIWLFILANGRRK